MKWEDARNMTYSISKLPSDVTWGVDRPFDSKSGVICNVSTNLPYTIWILGRISKLWFFEKGIPASQVSISIVPLDPEHGQIMRMLLASRSAPALRQ
jgi:hypothetical protein